MNNQLFLPWKQRHSILPRGFGTHCTIWMCTNSQTIIFHYSHHLFLVRAVCTIGTSGILLRLAKLPFIFVGKFSKLSYVSDTLPLSTSLSAFSGEKFPLCSKNLVCAESLWQLSQQSGHYTMNYFTHSFSSFLWAIYPFSQKGL